MPEVILVTGPARSGKSEWAEYWAQQMQKPVIYVATSTVSADDTEWQQRIEQHRKRRPLSWKTKEVPQNLADTIKTANSNDCLLIDSLGTWLANQLDRDDASWQQCVDGLLAVLNSSPCDVIMVAEETGWGVVPAYPLGRTFRDRLGYLVRRIGEIATQVYLITGGYALDLKHLGTPLPPQP
ncbi:MAG: bifunctional adenosylcobinamide kinase/adenosylcobinamide-phosphate guanylyltransferase [Cyanobacteria bacterium P01_F01_bin.13]